MVVRAVGVTPTLDVDSTAQGCVVSFGDVVAVGVVHLAVFLPLFYLPLGVDLLILNPGSLVLFACVVFAALGWVFLVFAFLWEDGVGKACVEGSVLDYVLEHGCEIEGFG